MSGTRRTQLRLRNPVGCALLLLATAVALVAPVSAQAQQAQRLAISTGGAGGVYNPLGGVMAAVLTRHIPGLTAIAEATGGSVDNLRLIGAGKADLGFAMVDAAWAAMQGLGKFKGARVDARTLMVLYPNRMQIVTVEGTGITRLADLKGKRISTGAPGSGVEVMALRVLEAMGIDPATDIVQQRLGVAKSVAAIREGTIDVFFWVGGVPTSALSELAASPGPRMRLIDHAEALEPMNRRYGPLYTKGTIPKIAYSGMEAPVQNIDVWNILVASDNLSEQLAYDIVKTLIERRPELVAVHRVAQNIDLKYQRIGSPFPQHPGARRYFEERGLKF